MRSSFNVFVVGTGRCGTSTFYQACKAITNFTCGHETQALSDKLPVFAAGHIEVSSGLCPLMGHLAQHYDAPIWVHLIRNRKDCTQSLANSARESMHRFALNWFHNRNITDLKAAELFYDCTNSLIAEFIRHQEKHITIELESVHNQWSKFWTLIGAVGNYEESLDTWKRKYNTASRRGRDVHT